MVFARVVRPPRYGARLLAFDEAALARSFGVVAVVSDGNFLAVAPGERSRRLAGRDAARFERALERRRGRAPRHGSFAHRAAEAARGDHRRGHGGQAEPVLGQVRRVSAEYSRAYCRMLRSVHLGALAWLKDGRMTYGPTHRCVSLRGDLAKVLGMQTSEVDVVHVAAPGCYGHNGADDVALDAALVARCYSGRAGQAAVDAGRRVRLGALRPAMAMNVEAALGPDGRIVDWSMTSGATAMALRPGQPGGSNLPAAWDLKAPFVKSPAPHIPSRSATATQCGALYELPRKRSATICCSMRRCATARSDAGAHGNIFAIESFWTSSPRLPATIPWRSASPISGIRGRRRCCRLPPTRRDGRRARKAMASAAALGVLPVQEHWDVCGRRGRRRGRPQQRVIKVPRVVMAADLGLVVNPDGAKNQLEGGIVQAVSLTLKEQVAFDRRQITSRDWSAYPVLTFPEVPSIDIVLMQRSDPSLGAGEGSLPPTSAALANAFAHATGRRLRELQ